MSICASFDSTRVGVVAKLVLHDDRLQEFHYPENEELTLLRFAFEMAQPSFTIPSNWRIQITNSGFVYQIAFRL
ncbi:hypothetical protein GQ457_15G012090 [Hibiscus cannabinus]